MSQHKAPKKCSTCRKDKHRVIACASCYKLERVKMEALRGLLQEWLDADQHMENGVCIKDWSDYEIRVQEALKP